MRSIYIRGGAAEEPGVLVLKEHLEGYGHKVVRSKERDYDVVVCYGCSMRDPLVKKVPSLNGNVNLYNKYQAMQRFDDKGVLTPTIFSLDEGEKRLPKYDLPWFARRLSHEKGKDIHVCSTRADVLKRIELRDADFFSVYVPHDMELRAWVFDGEVIAVYHKQYRNPGLDNFKNMEFRSELREDLLQTRTLTGGAIKSVEALRLDFGAVDILHGEDGKYYVLEVNSMPDISSTIRASGIRLAKKISRWAEAQ